VRLDGERLRVTSQLVRAADEVHLWAGNHDRRLDDLLKVQSEVSAQVAGALALQILPAGSGEAAEATPAAWREYLRGRAALGEEDSPRPAEAQAAFLRAVALDPGFARAWLALARTRWMLGATPRESAVASREDLAKSLDLDDSLAEAHATLAEIRFYVDWDFEGARAEWERALELDPGSAGIRHEFAAYWGSLGRHDEALRLVNEALRLDPLSPGVLSDVGWYSYFARRYGDAILRSRETLSRTPGYFWAGRCIVLSAMLAGDPAAAVPVVRDEMKGRGAAPSILSALDAANAPAAVRAYWGWDLDRRLAHPGGSGGSPADVAVARLALGDREGALAGLEKAVNARWGWILPFLGVDPFFDTLRREPRFERLLDRIGRAGRG
jgi:serine/threonine-protein kinase